MGEYSFADLLVRVETHYERDTTQALGYLNLLEIAANEGITDAARKVVLGFTKGAVAVAQNGLPSKGRELFKRSIDTAERYGLIGESAEVILSVAVSLSSFYLKAIKKARSEPRRAKILIAEARHLYY
jgi:hypothetical protein